MIGLGAVLLMLGLGRILGATSIVSGLVFAENREEALWRIAMVLGMIAAPGVIFLATGTMPAVDVPISPAMIAIGGVTPALVERALELCVEYANTRVQFGQPIGSYQLIQLKLAKMEVARLNLENLVFRFIETTAAGKQLTFAEASAMKLYSAQTAMEVATGVSGFTFSGADNASLTHLIVTSDRWIVRSFNDSSHLHDTFRTIGSGAGHALPGPSGAGTGAA